MNIHIKNIRSIAISTQLAIAAITAPQVFAQELPDSVAASADNGVIYVAPLFEYPIAPEELTDFGAKCDWLAENFWNKLDVKSKQPVDQAKLNHAFSTYASTCQYASRDIVAVAIDKLMKNMQKNPTLLLQFVKAAEESIYGPRAEIWIDGMYVRILNDALACKRFPKSRKAKYEAQLKKLQSSMVGETPATFDFTRPNGDPARFFPMGTPTIIIFGDPECDDCRRSFLRLETNVAFCKAVEDGKLNVLYIIPDPQAGWEKKVDWIPSLWSVGASDSVADIYDMRTMPEVYVIDKEGKISAKHVTALQAADIALSLLNSESNK